MIFQIAKLINAVSNLFQFNLETLVNNGCLNLVILHLDNNINLKRYKLIELKTSGLISRIDSSPE